MLALTVTTPRHPEKREMKVCSGDGSFDAEYVGIPLTTILRSLFGILEPRVQTRGELPDIRLDVTLKVDSPASIESARRSTAKALADSFGLDVSLVESTVPALVLATTQDTRVEDLSHLASGALRTSRDELVAVTSAMATIVEHLEPLLGIVVVDETGLDGAYDLTVPTGSVLEAQDALQTNYGLELLEAERTVDVLVLSASPPSSGG